MLQRKLSARVVADFSVAGGVSTEDEMPKFRAVHDYSLAGGDSTQEGSIQLSPVAGGVSTQEGSGGVSIWEVGEVVARDEPRSRPARDYSVAAPRPEPRSRPGRDYSVAGGVLKKPQANEGKKAGDKHVLLDSDMEDEKDSEDWPEDSEGREEIDYNMQI